jgi:pseudaminic acid synthase
MPSRRPAPFAIAGRTVGAGAPFVIAELSGNHNGSLDRALALVDAAADAGADAVKLQTYTADTMTLDLGGSGFRIDDPSNPWSGRTLYDIYREASTPWEWHAPVFERCAARGMVAFSTPFDDSAVAFLEELNVPAYKIASFENTDLPLLKRVAATGKPLIVSTGMANLEELDELVSTVRGAGCESLVLLKCTSSYPAPPELANLSTIPDLVDRYGVHAGLSDHTLGVAVAVAATALGATVIEKHLTLRRADGGVDSGFSMEPEELRRLVDECRQVSRAIGTPTYGPTEVEVGSLRHRRSLYVVEDMEAGDTITASNVRSIRPGDGLPPRHYDRVLGRRITQAVRRGTPLTWELIQPS